MAKETRSTKCLVLALAACAAFLNPGTLKAASYGDLPDLSLLTPYATFGKSYNDSNVTINGNSGISNTGTLSLAAPSTITGNLYLGTGATVSGPGSVGGSILPLNDPTNLILQQVVTASNTLAALTPDYTFTGTFAGQTFTRTGQVTVVDLQNLTMGSGQNVLFSGGANDYFVLNVSGDMALTGDATIAGVGDVTASHILVNLYNSNLKDLGVVAHVGNTINGTTLVPFDAATFHSVNGAIYSGDKTITLMSNATVNHIPFVSPVPIPGAGILLSSGLAGLGWSRRKMSSRKARM